MAPRPHHRGDRGAGSQRGPGRHRREFCHPRPGAGVNRNNPRGNRDLYRSYHGGGRTRDRVTPGERLMHRMTRMTTGNTRLNEGMEIGSIRSADRAPVDEGRIRDRTTHDNLQLVTHESDSHQSVARARGPPGRTRQTQDRTTIGQYNDVPVYVSNGTNHDEWDHDTPTSTPVRTHSRALFYASPSPPPSQAPARLPTLPTLAIPPFHAEISCKTATTSTPIRMFNDPGSSRSSRNHIAGPQPQPRSHEHSHRPVNTYRGKDKIKKMVQNEKLRAVLAGKPVPRERQVSREQKPQLTMRLGGDGGALDEV